MNNGATAVINLAALKHNFSQLKNVVGSSAILAMVKSNGYGHGLVRVAKALTDADGFGVASLHEALQLRQAGVDHPIVVMSGFLTEAELNQFAQYDLSPAVHRLDQVDMILQSQLQQPLSIWLQLDTGINRLGLSTAEFVEAFERLQQSDKVSKDLVVMTHLADADNQDHTFTDKQLLCFAEFTNGKTNAKSIANSAALYAYEQTRMEWVRPGIALYGVSPLSYQHRDDLGLRPVMTLSSEIIAVKQCRCGDSIGYGCAWQCPQDMPIAIVAIGYGDGYPRHAKNGTPVLVDGAICPLVGRVSMDMLAIDLRARPGTKVGDKVVLWGDDLPVEIIAEKSDTIAYELLCNIVARVQFVEVDDVGATN